MGRHESRRDSGRRDAKRKIRHSDSSSSEKATKDRHERVERLERIVESLDRQSQARGSCIHRGDEQNEIADRRVALTAILVDLLEQQKARRDQLLETINTIEQQRCISNVRRGSLFWLMQYQSLMEARPQGLLEMLEPMLVRHVAIAGALHCLPFLAALPSLLPDINDEQLKDMGISCEKDRSAIMLAIENYLAEVKLNESARSPVMPSAPLEEASTSSQDCNFIQNINMTECVVCLDSQCEVIFLPCGHLCCCSACADKILAECPMCRSPIERKVRVVQP